VLVAVAGYARNNGVESRLCAVLLCDDFQGDNMIKNSEMLIR
jgi:hypothetical protein